MSLMLLYIMQTSPIWYLILLLQRFSVQLLSKWFLLQDIKDNNLGEKGAVGVGAILRYGQGLQELNAAGEYQ